MLFNLNNSTVKKAAKTAEFGIEREGLRVNFDGTLARSKHPFKDNPHIDRDFCENQIEIISDVFTDPDLLNTQLNRFQNEINSVLEKSRELLWPFSNPPKISGEAEIPVASFSGELRQKTEYRNYLAEKYGKKKMLFSGIHLNISFSEQLLKISFYESGEKSYRHFKNGVYLKLAKRLTEYAWLAVYLTAASPVDDPSLDVKSNLYSSIRCSQAGYWNYFTPVLDYSSLEGYVSSIREYIDNKSLYSASELYYPVRIKPRGLNSLENLEQMGINHLELRVVDVNPLSRTGIFSTDIRFIHILLLYLSTLPEFDFTPELQLEAIQKVKDAAVFNNPEIKQHAESELAKIKAFTEKYFPEWSGIISFQLAKLKPGGSYAEIIKAQYEDKYMEKGIELARVYQRSVGNV